MYSISKECHRALQSNTRRFCARCEIVTGDGETLSLTTSDFKAGGIKLEEAVSSAGKFELGAAIMSKLSLTLNNPDGRFDGISWSGGRIPMLQIGVQLSSGATEYIPLGVFDIDSASTAGTAVNIKAFDALGRADCEMPDTAYPITVGGLLRVVCNYCGIPYAADDDMPNVEYVVQTAPQNVTCRDVISYIAQVAGCYARVNRLGYLELSWYGHNTPLWDAEDWLDGGSLDDYSSGDDADGGNFFDYSSGDNADGGDFSGRGLIILGNLKSLSGSPTIEITGVRYTEPDKQQSIINEDGSESITTVAGDTLLAGVEGYVFDVSGNPLIQHDAESIISVLGHKLIGDRFAPLSVTIAANPALEAGDIVRVTDRKGNVYDGYINICTYKYGFAQSMSCEAESETERKTDQSNTAVSLEKKVSSLVAEKLSGYNQQVQSLNNLILNSMGVYKTVIVADDGSTVYYTHDRPTLEESSYISCETANGYAYTNSGWNDGHPNWQYGLTAEGNVICNMLAAVGIIADWITVGRLESKDGSCYFDLDNNQLFASKIGLPTRYLKAGEIDTGGDTRAGIECYDEEISDNPYLQIRTLKMSADDSYAGYAFCDINGNPQLACLTGNNGGVGIYAYNESGERRGIFEASSVNKGAKISSLNGSNYITVTDNGINIYKDGTLVQSW